MAKRRNNPRQELVDSVFARCMQRDERTLDQIRQRIREACAEQPSHIEILRRWYPSDHELQIMISRNAMGEGEWAYLPAYSNPPRYISRARVMELCSMAERGQLTEGLRAELREQLADLRRGIAHWRAKHQRARQKERELTALVDDISMRAFHGHYDNLL